MEDNKVVVTYGVKHGLHQIEINGVKIYNVVDVGLQMELGAVARMTITIVNPILEIQDMGQAIKKDDIPGEKVWTYQE